MSAFKKLVVISVALVTTGLCAASCDDGNDARQKEDAKCSGAKCGGTGVSSYTLNACDKTYRFRVAGSLYKQERRNEVYQDAKQSEDRTIRLLGESLHTASTDEGSGKQKQHIDNLAEEMAQQCKVRGWRQP